MIQWSDWVEITTHTDDPSRIEMRRLSQEEAAAAYAEQLREYFTGYYNPLSDEEIAMIEEHESIFDPAPETSEVDHREAVKADLREKRLELLDNPPYPAYPKSVIQPVYREKHCRPKGDR